MMNIFRRPQRWDRPADGFYLLVKGGPALPNGDELQRLLHRDRGRRLWQLFEAGQLAPGELSRHLAPIWSIQEAFEDDAAISHEQWKTLWRAARAESGFTYNGHPYQQPRRPLTLYRSAEVGLHDGLSWSYSVRMAAGMGDYQRRHGRSATLWKCRVPPQRMLGFIHQEDEFVCDVTGLNISPVRRPPRNPARIYD